MKTVKVLDKEFSESLSSSLIQKRITELAKQMNNDLKGKDVVFIGILNGAFLFTADLFKKIDISCKITFLKFASYQGTSSTGKIKELIGINESFDNKTLIVVEDIIDTGITMDAIISQLKEHNPKEILIATLLFKPEAFVKEFKINYIGFEIPNDFVVGYGLDYDGFGRNLDAIYTLIK